MQLFPFYVVFISMFGEARILCLGYSEVPKDSDITKVLYVSSSQREAINYAALASLELGIPLNEHLAIMFQNSM